MCVGVGVGWGSQKSKEYWMVYIDVQYKAILSSLHHMAKVVNFTI